MRIETVSALLAVVVLHLLNGGACLAQRGAVDGKTIEPREFRRLLETDGVPAAHEKLTKQAMQSGREELIRVCLEFEYAGTFVKREVTAMPDSDARDRLVILLLEAGPPFWVPDSYLSFRPYIPSRAPFESVFKKYFPDQEFDPAMIRKQAGRLALVARLKKAKAERDAKEAAKPPLR